MLNPGNTKLGPSVWSWSVPAGQTCPGKTDLCFRLCYARGGRFRFRDVREAYEQAFGMTQDDGFVAWMVMEIRRTCAQVVRIHTAGDFYSAAYARAWLAIVRRCRGTQFYAYTRSWRDEKIRPVLEELALEPNVRLWYSCDRETGRPRRTRRVRRAWMAEHDRDPPLFPVDLVFRNEAKQPRKQLGGYQVCRYDQGVKRQLPVTCSHCRLCWQKMR